MRDILNNYFLDQTLGFKFLSASLEVEGNPRPYATIVRYSCTKQDWGYPSTGTTKIVRILN